MLWSFSPSRILKIDRITATLTTILYCQYKYRSKCLNKLYNGQLFNFPSFDFPSIYEIKSNKMLGAFHAILNDITER